MLYGPSSKQLKHRRQSVAASKQVHIAHIHSCSCNWRQHVAQADAMLASQYGFRPCAPKPWEHLIKEPRQTQPRYRDRLSQLLRWWMASRVRSALSQ
jgi:hypothetical protein